MYVLLTVQSIFSKPEEGPAVPAGMAVNICAMGLAKGAFSGHRAGGKDGDAPGDPSGATSATGAVAALMS